MKLRLLLQTKIKKKTYLRTIEYFNLFTNKLPRVLRFHDRISAGYSRELRFPFLDHNVIEIALSLSNDEKFKKDSQNTLIQNYIKTSAYQIVYGKRDPDLSQSLKF